jgi:hypothetical protein
MLTHSPSPTSAAAAAAAHALQLPRPAFTMPPAASCCALSPPGYVAPPCNRARAEPPPLPPPGRQYGELLPNATGTFCQDVSVKKGQTYKLTYFYGLLSNKSPK